MTKSFIIIVHFGEISVTVDCLESIYTQKDSPSTILVDNTLDPVLSERIGKFKKVTLLTPDNNLGFAGANNLGIKKALSLGSENIILLNNDTLVPPGFFKKIIDFASKEKSVGLVSPKIYFAPGFEYHKNNKKNKNYTFWYAGGLIDWDNVYASHRGVDEEDSGQCDVEINTDFATGCALLIRKDVIKKIGLIDENYFLYFEDVDYSLKAKSAGFKVKYFPGAYILHKNASSSQGSGSLLHQYYLTRNRLYFGFKFARLRTKLALFKESMLQIFKGGIKRKAVLDYYFGPMGKTQL